MDIKNGKHFSITDPKGVKTVIYEIFETNKEYLDKYPKYTVERLTNTEELRGESNKKTYYVEEPFKNGNHLAIMSFAEGKVIVNTGLLIGEEVRILKKPLACAFNTVYSEAGAEYKEIAYSPNLKRQIAIIDPDTAEELKPKLYFDNEKDQIRGKCKLQPNKSYLAFEIR